MMEGDGLAVSVERVKQEREKNWITNCGYGKRF